MAENTPAAAAEVVEATPCEESFVANNNDNDVNGQGDGVKGTSAALEAVSTPVPSPPIKPQPAAAAALDESLEDTAPESEQNDGSIATGSDDLNVDDSNLPKTTPTAGGAESKGTSTTPTSIEVRKHTCDTDSGYNGDLDGSLDDSVTEEQAEGGAAASTNKTKSGTSNSNKVMALVAALEKSKDNSGGDNSTSQSSSSPSSPPRTRRRLKKMKSKGSEDELFSDKLERTLGGKSNTATTPPISKASSTVSNTSSSKMERGAVHAKLESLFLNKTISKSFEAAPAAANDVDDDNNNQAAPTGEIKTIKVTPLPPNKSNNNVELKKEVEEAAKAQVKTRKKNVIAELLKNSFGSSKTAKAVKTVTCEETAAAAADLVPKESTPEPTPSAKTDFSSSELTIVSPAGEQEQVDTKKEDPVSEEATPDESNKVELEKKEDAPTIELKKDADDNMLMKDADDNVQPAVTPDDPTLSLDTAKEITSDPHKNDAESLSKPTGTVVTSVEVALDENNSMYGKNEASSELETTESALDYPFCTSTDIVNGVSDIFKSVKDVCYEDSIERTLSIDKNTPHGTTTATDEQFFAARPDLKPRSAKPMTIETVNTETGSIHMLSDNQEVFDSEDMTRVTTLKKMNLSPPGGEEVQEEALDEEKLVEGTKDEETEESETKAEVRKEQEKDEFETKDKQQAGETAVGSASGGVKETVDNPLEKSRSLPARKATAVPLIRRLSIKARGSKDDASVDDGSVASGRSGKSAKSNSSKRSNASRKSTSSKRSIFSGKFDGNKKSAIPELAPVQDQSLDKSQNVGVGEFALGAASLSYSNLADDMSVEVSVQLENNAEKVEGTEKVQTEKKTEEDDGGKKDEVIPQDQNGTFLQLEFGEQPVSEVQVVSKRRSGPVDCDVSVFSETSIEISVAKGGEDSKDRQIVQADPTIVLVPTGPDDEAEPTQEDEGAASRKGRKPLRLAKGIKNFFAKKRGGKPPLPKTKPPQKVGNKSSLGFVAADAANVPVENPPQIHRKSEAAGRALSNDMNHKKFLVDPVKIVEPRIVENEDKVPAVEYTGSNGSLVHVQSLPWPTNDVEETEVPKMPETPERVKVPEEEPVEIRQTMSDLGPSSPRSIDSKKQRGKSSQGQLSRLFSRKEKRGDAKNKIDSNDQDVGKAYDLQSSPRRSLSADGADPEETPTKSRRWMRKRPGKNTGKNQGESKVDAPDADQSSTFLTVDVMSDHIEMSRAPEKAPGSPTMPLSQSSAFETPPDSATTRAIVPPEGPVKSDKQDMHETPAPNRDSPRSVQAIDAQEKKEDEGSDSQPETDFAELVRSLSSDVSGTAEEMVDEFRKTIQTDFVQETLLNVNITRTRSVDPQCNGEFDEIPKVAALAGRLTHEVASETNLFDMFTQGLLCCSGPTEYGPDK